VSEYSVFFRERNELWRKGILVDEDDARTSNSMAQRKSTVPHSTMKN